MGGHTSETSSAAPRTRWRAEVASPDGRIPEPVFGQIKQAMGFRRFSMRGMHRAEGEWALICTCHDIRKLWAARQADRL